MEWIPKWIAWESTRRCNLSCIHCRCGNSTNEPAELNTAEAFQLIDRIAAYCQPVFVISGGEPLLREDVFDIIHYANAKGFRVCLATNGSLLTEERCQQLKEQPLRMVSLSLDGDSADVHDNFRQSPGAFAHTVKAAQLLHRFEIPFLINSSFTRRNQSAIPATLELAKSLGARAWYMFMVVPTGHGEQLMDELIRQPDYDRILRWHYEQEKRERILMRPTCAPHYYRLVEQWNRAAAPQDQLQRRSLSFSTGGSKGCIAGQSICFINVTGDIHPCSYLPLTAGNIFEQEFKTIWEEAELFKQLRDFKTYQGSCGRCSYQEICGGCRARAYCQTGNPLAPEPFCHLQSSIPEAAFPLQ